MYRSLVRLQLTIWTYLGWKCGVLQDFSLVGRGRYTASYSWIADWHNRPSNYKIVGRCHIILWMESPQFTQDLPIRWGSSSSVRCFPGNVTHFCVQAAAFLWATYRRRTRRLAWMQAQMGPRSSGSSWFAHEFYVNLGYTPHSDAIWHHLTYEIMWEYEVETTIWVYVGSSIKHLHSVVPNLWFHPVHPPRILVGVQNEPGNGKINIL